MNYLDIIIGLPLLWTAYKGFRDGIAMQLAGIAGIIIGGFIAYRYGAVVGSWMGLEGVVAEVAGFLALLISIVICLSLLGRLLRGAFRFVGLGALDSVGGALLGVLKMGLLISILLLLVDTVSFSKKWISEESISHSLLYKPVRSIAPVVFPYLEFVKDRYI